MADCFNLSNATELVVKCEEWIAITKLLKANDLTEHIEKCADAIEQFAKDIDVLTKENEKLKAERDAAVADLKSIAPCQKCKHFGVNQMTCDALEKCLYGEEQAWAWRGVKMTEG